MGRDELAVAPGVSIGIYSAERSVVDAFRTRGTSGSDLAVEALRRWLRRPGAQPSLLLETARTWPRAYVGIRSTMELLL